MKYSIRKNNLCKALCQRIMALTMSWAVILIFLLHAPAAVAAPPADSDKPAEERKVTTARDAFTYLNIPPLEILKRTTRLDMLDYWDADSVYKASNAMAGLSWIEECTPGYMRVRLTPVSTLELKMIHTKKDGTVTMAIYTIGSDSQAEDSEITFSNEKLHPLEAKKFFRQPKLEEFFDIPKGSITSMKEIKEMIPFTTVAYSASPDSNDLTARLTVEKFMNTDDWNIIKLFLKPSITVRLKGL